MIALVRFFLSLVGSLLKPKLRLAAENAALRHQLIVLRRKMRGRAWLTNNDRWFFIQMYRWFPSMLQVLTITCAESCDSMLVTTTTSEHIGRWIKMRRSLARFSELESSVHTRYTLRAVRSIFSEEKKLSIAALSQTLPERLIEQTTP
jgi:hypothetical protein